MFAHAAVGISGLLAICGTVATAQDIDWLNPGGGLWDDAGNWDGGNVPDSIPERGVFGLVGAYDVLVSNDQTFGGFTIDNPDMTLVIGTSSTQTLHGDIVNHGSVVMNPSGAVSNAALRFERDASIIGSGDIRMHAFAYNNLSEIDSNGFTITHGSGHSIMGSGVLDGTWINEGDIVADDPSGMELEIEGEVVQLGSGRIIADGGVLTIEGDVSINGGELLCMHDSTINFNSREDLFVHLTNYGTINFPQLGHSSGGTIFLDDDLLNEGVIDLLTLEHTSGVVRLEFTQDATILGQGAIRLGSRRSYDPDDATLHAANATTLTIGSEQRIEGSGTIDTSGDGMIINNGTIVANNSGDTLLLSGVHAPGAGVYRAEDGGFLGLGNGWFTGVRFDSDEKSKIQIRESVSFHDVINDGEIEFYNDCEDLIELRITSSITNNGILRVNPADFIFENRLHFAVSASIKGTGIMQVDGTVSAEDDVNITIESGQTIVGTGYFSGGKRGSIINKGLIAGTDMGDALTLAGTEIRAEGGRFVGDHGVLSFIGGSVLNGITLETIGTGVISTYNTTLIDVTNLGSMSIPVGGTFLATDFLNEGVCTIHALLRAMDDVVIDGVGVIQLQDGVIGAEDGNTLTIGAGQVVEGYGSLGSSPESVIINRGMIRATDPVTPIKLVGIHVPEQGGSYRADGGCIELLDGLNLRGATFESSDDGMVEMRSDGISVLTDTHNKGTLGVVASVRGQIHISGSMINDGTVLINSDGGTRNAKFQLRDDALIEGEGTIRMVMSRANYTNARLEVEAGGAATIGSGQRLVGEGLVRSGLTILGTIDPEGTYRNFSMESVSLGASSRVHLDLGGTEHGTFDRIEVRGGQVMDLDGAIEVVIEQGYQPSVGDAWEIINGSTRGAFDEVNLPEHGGDGMVYRLIYDTDRVFVVLTCEADLNGDGGLNLDDVNVFLSAYDAMDPIADFNDDGVFNFFDVAGFLSAFHVGCP